MSGWTFNELIDDGYSVTAHCESCNHSASLDLMSLRERFGGNHSAMAWDINPRLRCKHCNEKNGTIRITPGTKVYKDRNPYQNAKGQ